MIFPAKSAVDPEVAAKVPSTSNPIEHQHSLLHHAVGKDQELVPGMEKIFLHVREMEKKYLAIKDGHFNAAEPRNRRVPKQRALQENDGRAPDTIAALAAADFQFNTAGSTPSGNLPTGPSAAHSRHFLKSYKWDAPNSRFFDNVMEIWYRAFSRWPDQKRALFLSWLPPRSALADFFYHFQRRLRWIASASPDDLDGVRELGLGQAKARYAIFTRWKLYSNPAAYGSSIVWIPHAIRDCDPCDDVQLTFGVGHFLSGTCSAKHSCSIAVGGIQTVLSIDPFDLRVAHETVVHSFPAPDCEEPDCLGESSPLVLETIETVWPKILHIDPYTGTQDPLLHTKVFTIDDGQGGLIVYELIGTISHDAEKLHWTSKFLIDDITFSYDDLARGGSLVAQGPGDVIIEPDRTAVLWVYHRSTDIMESQKKLLEIETTYEVALQQDLKRPKTPPMWSILLPPSPPSPATLRYAHCGVMAVGRKTRRAMGYLRRYSVKGAETGRTWNAFLQAWIGALKTSDLSANTALQKNPLGEFLWRGKDLMVPDPNVPDWRAPATRWYPATFIERHKNAAPHNEYEFRWYECNDGIIYDSKSSILPPLFLRRFTRSRKFCEEIAEVDLTAKQIGKVRLPFYMLPDHPDHKNPELEEIFEAAIPQVAKILVDFDPGHPVIGNFKEFIKSVKATERRRGVSDWMRTFGLAPTPEMEVVLSSPLTSLLDYGLLSDIPESERQERVLGVGAVLLQLLAVQNELREPLNLNGDILDDLITERVVSCLSDGPQSASSHVWGHTTSQGDYWRSHRTDAQVQQGTHHL
ncbi:hypothetical protein B0H14DRAFT_2567952 [Mycena olivaceomarginata]|nr:hypothetical protein B0H14DRAFT_2567952 [Mycena olivaceomarginata]